MLSAPSINKNSPHTRESIVQFVINHTRLTRATFIPLALYCCQWIRIRWSLQFRSINNSFNFKPWRRHLVQQVHLVLVPHLVLVIMQVRILAGQNNVLLSFFTPTYNLLSSRPHPITDPSSPIAATPQRGSRTTPAKATPGALYLWKEFRMGVATKTVITYIVGEMFYTKKFMTQIHPPPFPTYSNAISRCIVPYEAAKGASTTAS